MKIRNLRKKIFSSWFPNWKIKWENINLWWFLLREGSNIELHQKMSNGQFLEPLTLLTKKSTNIPKFNVLNLSFVHVLCNKYVHLAEHYNKIGETKPFIVFYY